MIGEILGKPILRGTNSSFTIFKKIRLLSSKLSAKYCCHQWLFQKANVISYEDVKSPHLTQ
jgi:hypothetical protein